MEKKIKSPKVIKAKKIDNSSIYDKNKSYSLNEAIKIVKSITKTKFDASVEVHFRLGINTKKSDQQIRGAVSLPHGTGKTIKIAAFVSPENEAAVKAAGADFVGGEDLVAEIKKTEKTDFQVAIAEVSMMRTLAQIAKILGTRGLMPSPKNDTVTQNPVKAVEELKKGKISFKNDDTGNLHAIIGKVSFSDDKLAENFNSLLETIRKAKPSASKGTFIKNTSLSSSMSTGVKVSL
ncbi:50S ribosomal protein L1 [Candidatus Falkowbacteria bacterium]|nr:50S ribosomal protein L1 [Candidatus Falkowbacteria bacterium]NCT54544.1 50S ribosomal protein L1 [Candidatus Falkowbacteria bacterium]